MSRKYRKQQRKSRQWQAKLFAPNRFRNLVVCLILILSGCGGSSSPNISRSDIAGKWEGVSEYFPIATFSEFELFENGTVIDDEGGVSKFDIFRKDGDDIFGLQVAYFRYSKYSWITEILQEAEKEDGVLRDDEFIPLGVLEMPSSDTLIFTNGRDSVIYRKQ